MARAERTDDVLHVTFDRPEKRNALRRTDIEEATAALDDPDLRAVERRIPAVTICAVDGRCRRSGSSGPGWTLRCRRPSRTRARPSRRTGVPSARVTPVTPS